jgi:hypothetical protein
MQKENGVVPYHIYKTLGPDGVLSPHTSIGFPKTLYEGTQFVPELIRGVLFHCPFIMRNFDYFEKTIVKRIIKKIHTGILI